MLTETQVGGTGAVREGLAPSPRRTILVGVDGSDAAGAAFSWAAAEASRAGDLLRVVHVRQAVGRLLTLESRRYASVPSADGERQLRDAVVSFDHAPIEMVKLVLDGRPPEVLVAESAAADLLVLGADGTSHRTGLLLGDVVAHCVRYSACPIVVVPSPARTAR